MMTSFTFSCPRFSYLLQGRSLLQGEKQTVCHILQQERNFLYSDQRDNIIIFLPNPPVESELGWVWWDARGESASHLVYIGTVGSEYDVSREDTSPPVTMWSSAKHLTTILVFIFICQNYASQYGRIGNDMTSDWDVLRWLHQVMAAHPRPHQLHLGPRHHRPGPDPCNDSVVLCNPLNTSHLDSSTVSCRRRSALPRRPWWWRRSGRWWLTSQWLSSISVGSWWREILQQ